MKHNNHWHLMTLCVFMGLFFLMAGIGKADTRSEGHRKMTEVATVDQGSIIAILADAKFLQQFPLPGTHVVSWYVMMGMGQVVTLEVPAKQLRQVNLAVERAGWKAYRTEFYATYNLYPFIQPQLTNKSLKCLKE